MVAGIGAVVLLAGAVATIPFLVEADAVKRAVERRIAAVIGGSARYESISLSFLPRPRVQLRGLTVSVPDAVDGRIAAADVRIALLPLVAGDVRPVSVHIEQPQLTVRRSPDSSPDPLAAYRATAGPIVETLTREAPGLSVMVTGGSLNIVSAGQSLVALSDLQIEVDVFPEKLVANFSAVANLWRGARGQLNIAAGSLAASANVALDGLKGDELLATITGEGALAVRPGAVDVSLEVATDGRKTARVAANVVMKHLKLERGARSLDVGASKIEWEDAREGETVTVTLRALQLGPLLASATGTLRMRKDGAQPAFDLQVPSLDLGRLREAALVLAGDLGAVRAVAGMATTGTLRGLTLNVAGADFDVFSQLKAIAARAEVEAATVAVPATGIVVKNGSGRLSLAEGVLQGSELSGAIGRSTFRSGTLAVALAPAVTLRSLRAEVDADLADALAISRNLLGPRNGAALSEIESLQGRASGSVTYDALRGKPHLAVKVARLRGGGRLRGVPFPLEVSHGELDYKGERVDVRGLAGSVGRSRLQNAQPPKSCWAQRPRCAPRAAVSWPRSTSCTRGFRRWTGCESLSAV